MQSDIVFENLHQQAEIPILINCVTPLKNVKVVGGTLVDTKVNLTALSTSGMTYEPVNLLFLGVSFAGKGTGELVSTTSARTAKVKIVGSITENDDYNPTFGAGVTVLS